VGKARRARLRRTPKPAGVFLGDAASRAGQSQSFMRSVGGVCKGERSHELVHGVADTALHGCDTPVANVPPTASPPCRESRRSIRCRKKPNREPSALANAKRNGPKAQWRLLSFATLTRIGIPAHTLRQGDNDKRQARAHTKTTTSTKMAPYARANFAFIHGNYTRMVSLGRTTKGVTGRFLITSF
jgi:hypothetical protein